MSKKPPTPPVKKGKITPPKQAMRVPSETATALIAPSDFQHIYDGAAEEAEEKAVKQKVPAEVAEREQQLPKATGKDTLEVTSTPMSGIAPSDFQHIFRDQEAIKAADNHVRKVASAFGKPTTSLTKLKKKVPKKTSPKNPASGWGPSEEEESEDSDKCQHAEQKGNAQKISGLREKEVLPEEIVKLVKKFIDRQQKTYTIKQ